MRYELQINGERRAVDAEPDTPLLWVLRDTLGLVGTKFGCGMAQCGACTVHVDGETARSCVLPVSLVGDRSIETIEAIDGSEARAVEEAWIAEQVPQCGYCQSGQVMTAVALLRENPTPDDDAIDAAMAGNVCRCATYGRIRRAIHQAANRLAETES